MPCLATITMIEIASIHINLHQNTDMYYFYRIDTVENCFLGMNYTYYHNLAHLITPEITMSIK